MPRFVILYHQMPAESKRASHWDLMLETGQVLRTWALDDQPQPGSVINATALSDHRLAYLDYEGPVSGNRGVVERWDEGEYRLRSNTASQWQIELRGKRLACDVELAGSSGNSNRWTVVFGPVPNDRR